MIVEIGVPHIGQQNVEHQPVEFPWPFDVREMAGTFDHRPLDRRQDAAKHHQDFGIGRSAEIGRRQLAEQAVIIPRLMCRCCCTPQRGNRSVRFIGLNG